MAIRSKNHRREVDLDVRQGAWIGLHDDSWIRTQHAFHQRDDEAVAAGQDKVRAPVAQRAIRQANTVAKLGNQVLHQARLEPDIGDIDTDIRLAMEDVRQKLRIELAEVCGKLFDGLVVAKASGKLGQKCQIHAGSHIIHIAGHLGQAALLSPPPGFIISCSTASIDGRSLAGNRLAAILESDLRNRSVHIGNQCLLDDDVEAMLLGAYDLDLVAERRDHAIGQEDAKHGANESGTDKTTQKLPATR